jgi:hypothetical protein
VAEPSTNSTGSGNGGGSVFGTAASLLVLAATAAATLVSKAWHGLTGDGVLAASARQGAGELSQALKAFPETISAQEPGTILNPTQGEIAASRSQSRPGLGFGQSSFSTSTSSASAPPRPWPSEIAQAHKHQASPSQGHSHDAGHSL